MLLSAALAYIETIAASLGNTFPTYKSCVESCSSDICSSGNYFVFLVLLFLCVLIENAFAIVNSLFIYHFLLFYQCIQYFYQLRG